MTRTLRYLLLFVFTALSGSVLAQEISGTVLDDKKQPLPSAAVQVYQGGILKGGNVTDFDGNYTIKPLDPGYYDVLVLYPGFDSMMVTGVVVVQDHRTTEDFTMSKPKGITLTGFTKIEFRKKLVDVNNPDTRVATRDEINAMPVSQLSDIVANTGGLYQSQRGQDVYSAGGRNTGNVYYIDGVQVMGVQIGGSTQGIDMAQGSVDQVEVIQSGIPAKYGDVSGTVVNITSRGVAQKLTGDVRLQHSIDGYNNNLGSFSLAGPIYKKTINGDKTHKKPVLGFSLSGDFYDDNDRYPNYNEQYVVKPSVLNTLLANPLKIISDNSGAPVYNYASDYVTLNDLEQTKIPPHDVIKEARLNGKLDYQVTNNMHIVAGGTFDYTSSDLYSPASIFTSNQTPVRNITTGSGFVRFTQKFGNATDTSSKNIISNAYYSIQADYQKAVWNEGDPTFKSNIFDYSYIGQFIPTTTKTYLPLQTDSVSGRTATILQGTSTTSIAFIPDPGHMNQDLANYTTQYYNSLSPANYPTQLTQIEAANVLANGDLPKPTYMVSSPGTPINFYEKVNNTQYGLTVDASFDLSLGGIKHAIGFGLYYQQRIEDNFYVYAQTPFGFSLWAYMRQLVSSVSNGQLALDKTNPIFLVNGKQYSYAQVKSGQVIPGPSDTIIYNYQNIGNTVFDQNLRKKLGVSNTADINIDQYGPSEYSLNMFSADELLNSGGSFVGYQGYTYTGAAQPGNVNFNDFWTAKDASGNYTRPIGAFSPNYIAGYLQDQFTYKDVHFNIGVRVDRYSANTKVLIDPYSEYAEKTVSQVPGALNLINGGEHPANIGGNYVVYVDNNNSAAPNIIGYRSGDNWYDPKGNLIQDPSTLKQYSGGIDPSPFLVNPSSKITDTNFNPNSSFTDYVPKVTVQPRVNFSFPISDVADFFAHYDIYAQRPTGQVDATAATYYFLQQNATSIIPNSNLSPQLTYDYEVGFQQKLTDHSALTLNAYYKERKDMITIVPIIDAYPVTYYTYGNRDFSTTKGTTVNYDLRATNHFRMNLSYTLQFAEGSGSTPTSTNSNGGNQVSPNGLLQNFIEAGVPNLRYVTALNYDSRHNIVANFDYRYKDGEGPVVSGMNILQNAGLDIIAKARSGEPYTALSDAQSNTVIGGVNGSRLPWHYGVDLRIDKDFSLTVGKRHKDALAGVKPKKPLFIKAIIQANNVLNTRDILGVYGYTGRPDNNGYLTSSYGKQIVPQQINPATYSLLYSITDNNPANLNYARTISFALQFGF